MVTEGHKALWDAESWSREWDGVGILWRWPLFLFIPASLLMGSHFVLLHLLNLR